MYGLKIGRRRKQEGEKKGLDMECTMVKDTYSHFAQNVKYFGSTHFMRWTRESGEKSFDAAIDTKRTSSPQSCVSPGHVSSFGYSPYKARAISHHQTMQLKFRCICLMNNANGQWIILVD
jgi:hypothetical protein